MPSIDYFVLVHPLLAVAVFDLGIAAMALKRFRQAMKPEGTRTIVFALVTIGGLVNLGVLFCPPTVIEASLLLAAPCLYLLLSDRNGDLGKVRDLSDRDSKGPVV